jgi:hypothetical protein
MGRRTVAVALPDLRLGDPRRRQRLHRRRHLLDRRRVFDDSSRILS